MLTNAEEKISTVDEKICQMLDQRSHQDAIQVLRHLIKDHKNNSCSEVDPFMAHLYNWLGMCYYKAVEFDEAHVHYSTAIDYDCKCAAAYYNRGTVCYRMGVADAAVPDMEEAVRLDPDNPEFVLGLKSARELQKHPKM